ncbi:hypothetical protein OUY22_18445 [Nonomuraea sp. MCN248]|uniref:Uncharacterized protein n=1 Tax=Nonomuraea corallina TaxID=2989783 RepID=A0ABT4SDY6_9ACTN|nr:hypothetical protein [Nonomuraea corallina]MDA0635406.1 hypothetical protein [Nonomuraea corallina]
MSPAGLLTGEPAGATSRNAPGPEWQRSAMTLIGSPAAATRNAET